MRQSTRLLREQLSPDQDALSRYTHRHVGHILHPAYESWELSFLQEPDPDRELLFWMRVVAYFIDRCRDPESEVAFIARWCAGELTTNDRARIDLWQEEVDFEEHLCRAFQDGGLG